MNKVLRNGLLIFYIFILSVIALSDEILTDEANNEFVHESVYAGCSDWKPYCYKVGDHLQGSLVDISKAILDNAKIQYSFDVYPWMRVYHQGLNKENFLVLGLGRTEKREALFKWVAPLKKTTSIYAYQDVNSKIVLTNPVELKNYDIAVERGSYTHDYLIEQGHDKKKMIVVARYDQLYNMVLHDRAQLFLLDSQAFQPEAIRHGFDPKSFKPSIKVFSVTEYLATSKKTSDEMVKKLQASYKKLMQQGKINLPN